MATGLVLPTTLPTSWSTSHSEQYFSGRQGRTPHFRFYVSRPDGHTWEDLTDYLAYAEVELGRVTRFGDTAGVDQVIRRATFTLAHDRQMIPGSWQGNSFHPRDRQSQWNYWGGEYNPLLFSRRECIREVAITEIGSHPGYFDWVRLFEGVIGDRITNVDSGGVEIECRDKAKILTESYIGTRREYGSEDGTPAEDVIRQILIDNGWSSIASDLWVPVSPGFMITPYEVDYQTVWDAIQQVAEQIGWFLGFRYRPMLGKFVLTFMEPPREKDASSADMQLTADDVILAQQLDISDVDIRNKVSLTFRNRATGERETITVEDQASIALYGERLMQIEEDDASLIDTPEEGLAYALRILSDLKDMTATTQIEARLLPSLDIFHGITVDDDRLSSTVDFYGVESVRHVLDMQSDEHSYRTEVIGSGRVIGGHARWLEMETRPGAKRPLKPEESVGGGRVIPNPVGVTARGIIRGVAIDVPVPPVNANRWAETEIHLSTTDGFIPSEVTQIDGGRKTHFELTDDGAQALVAGTTYYLRARYKDVKGGTSAYSDQVSAVAGSVGGADINAILLYSVADDLSGQVINPGIWMLNAEGDSYTDDAGDATSLNASPGDRISIEAYRSSFLFRGIFEQIARWAVSESGLDTVLENTEFIVGTQGAPGIYPVTAPSAHIVKGTNLRTLKFRTRFGTIEWEETDNIPVESLGWAEGFLVSRIRYEPSTIKLYINDVLVATHASSANWNGVPFVEVRNTGSNFSSIYLDYFIQMYV